MGLYAVAALCTTHNDDCALLWKGSPLYNDRGMCNPLRKTSIKQQTIWHSTGNASISWKIHLGRTANELTMPDTKCVTIETQEASCWCIYPFQLPNTHQKRAKRNISMKNTHWVKILNVIPRGYIPSSIPNQLHSLKWPFAQKLFQELMFDTKKVNIKSTASSNTNDIYRLVSSAEYHRDNSLSHKAITMHQFNPMPWTTLSSMDK